MIAACLGREEIGFFGCKNCSQDISKLFRGHGYRDGRFGSKVGQICQKWDKSGAFSDQISVHLARGAKCTEI